MNTYEFDIVVQGTVEAFTLDDAIDLLDDTFGDGDYGEITVDRLSVQYIEEKDD
jgi:hypothetical protein